MMIVGCSKERPNSVIARKYKKICIKIIIEFSLYLRLIYSSCNITNEFSSFMAQ